MQRPSVVIDPGHGGASNTGGVGSAGTREKDLTLALAERVRRALGDVRVLLTRESDQHLPASARIARAAAANAGVFVSLHFNEKHAAEVFVHERAGENSAVLAERILGHLSEGPGTPQRAKMAVLDPRRHHADTAACLLEVADLADASEEERLRDGRYLDHLARKIAAGIREHLDAAIRFREEKFDVWNEVPLVAQKSGMSCWAAAAAMIVGWRRLMVLDDDDFANSRSFREAYRDGLEPHDVATLASMFELIVEPPRVYTVETLRRMLERYGPLWVGEASPGLHVVVVVGMSGDGSLDNTFVRINDPWPIGRGERYTIPFREFAENLRAVEDVAGVSAQVLHGDGRARGNSASHFQERLGPRSAPERAWPIGHDQRSWF